MDFDLLDFADNEELDNALFNDIGLCGCGYFNDVVRIIYEYLKIKNEMLLNYSYFVWKEWQNDFIEKNKEELFEFMKYILDNRGFTEHGTSVDSAWITSKGKRLIQLIEQECEVEK